DRKMSLKNDYTKWLRRGCQRAAVAQVLRKPMTPAQICVAARPLNPRIQLRDIWLLMRQFKVRGLAVCPNPKQITGRLYYLSDKGRAAVLSAFGISFEGPSQG